MSLGREALGSLGSGHCLPEGCLGVAWRLDRVCFCLLFQLLSLLFILKCHPLSEVCGEEVIGFSGKQLTGARTSLLDNLTVWLASKRAICHVILTWTLCQAKLFLLPFRDRFQKKNLEGFVALRCNRGYAQVGSFKMCF